MHAGGQNPASQAEVLRALETLQQRLRAGGAEQPALRFNALLQQACEHFPGADTLRLIQPLSPDMSVAVIEVRLAMMKRTLEREVTGAASPRPAGAERRPSERRRWQRRPVTWTAWLVLGQGDALAATAMDASRHGLRLVLDGGRKPIGFAHGQKCGVEIHLAGNGARFFRDAEVCHVDERGIGLTIAEPLPAVLVPSTEAPGSAPPERRPWSLLSKLFALPLLLWRW